jgi:hypothetical protein
MEDLSIKEYNACNSKSDPFFFFRSNPFFQISKFDSESGAEAIRLFSYKKLKGSFIMKIFVDFKSIGWVKF